MSSNEFLQLWELWKVRSGKHSVPRVWSQYVVAFLCVASQLVTYISLKLYFSRTMSFFFLLLSSRSDNFFRLFSLPSSCWLRLVRTFKSNWRETPHDLDKSEREREREKIRRQLQRLNRKEVPWMKLYLTDPFHNSWALKSVARRSSRRNKSLYWEVRKPLIGESERYIRIGIQTLSTIKCPNICRWGEKYDRSGLEFWRSWSFEQAEKAATEDEKSCELDHVKIV